MKESARPAPASTPRGHPALAASLSKSALRVKDIALDVADLANDLADGYRKSTRYFKLRLVVVGAWLLLSIATIGLVAAGGGGRGNALGADVQAQETLLGMQIKVENTSNRMWTDVMLTLDGGWQRSVSTLRAGQLVVVATSSFTRDGVAAPRDLKPRSITIECAEGKVTTELSGGSP